MATVVTPHEVFMALMPTRFPWTCKVITDFRLLLDMMPESGEADGFEDEDEQEDLANNQEYQEE